MTLSQNQRLSALDHDITTMSTTRQSDRVDDLVTFLERYHREDVGELAQHYPRDQQSLAVDYQNLVRYDVDLADDALAEPQRVSDELADALDRFDLPIDIDLSEANVRLTNLPETAQREIGSFRSADASKLVSINGQVTRKTISRPRVETAVFGCQRCGYQQTIPQMGDDLQTPMQCESCERQGPFELNVGASTVVDHQRVRVQTPPERSGDSSSESVDIDLVGDLVDRVDVGQRATVNTILEARPEESGESASRLLSWEAEGQSVTAEDTTFEDLDVNEHVDRIKEIAAGDPFEDVVASVNPSHKGDEIVKLAIGLQLFGGVRREKPDGSIRRGDSHILLVGDPGCGKSAFLQWARKLSPRSIYTSGKASTAAGLTAACVPDDFGDGGYTIEGGAMVKAHEGIAAVDELDKMESEDRGAMFEALAEQTISVQKAGIEATLPAQTRLLAAANPKYGRFDQYEPIPEQIDLDPALISRFDLIFPFTDSVDPELDREIAQHMNRSTQAAADAEGGGSDVENGVAPAIEPEVMRAYIAYARQTCQPRLSDAAADLIEKKYLQIRTANADEDETAIPTTPRMVEALQRLSEASARIRLADSVEPGDVERAMQPFQAFLERVGVDPDTGDLDADMIESGHSRSQADRRKAVLAAVEDADGIEREELADILGEDMDKIEHAVEKLKRKGELYEPEQGVLRGW